MFEIIQTKIPYKFVDKTYKKSGFYDIKSIRLFNVWKNYYGAVDFYPKSTNNANFKFL
jgi:hypothetical protein